MEGKPRSREEAEHHINQIRERRGFVNGSEANFTNVNREDLEASISILAEGLYDKSTHFLFELIQNADDCLYNVETPEMLFGYCDGRLRVDYNEVGFTSRDVEALCRIGRTTKYNNGNQIGEKGIGFKSVFKIADVVWISSGHYSFKFDRTTSNLGMVTPEWDTFPATPDPNYTSVLLQLRDDYNQEELLQEMRSMDPRCLLFLRNLKRIDIGIKQSLMPDWQTILRRIDDEGSNELRRYITLAQDDRTKAYLVRQFMTPSLLHEPRRPGQKQSSILLAFPYIDGQDDVLESQQVYAFLPIHDYGFKFLVHADFLLTANRGEIDSSSEWNRELSEAILDAFMEEARHFHDTPFRYTWPKYIPDEMSKYDFFYIFRKKLVNKLRAGAIIECEDGHLRTPPTVTYVPNAFRAENNMHILGGEAVGPKYLSHNFSNSDCQRLARIGVPTLSKREFLNDLRDSLSASNAVPTPVVWYSNVAKALLLLIASFEQEITDLIFDLPLIPLSDGRWVAASSGTIFLPEDTPNHTVPHGIEIFEVRRNFYEDRDCERLYKSLQVKPFSVPAIQELILKKHSIASPEPEPSRSDLLSQALFLFRSGWKKQDPKPAPFWVNTRSGTLRRAQDVYVDSDHKYSASRYLGRTTVTFPFLHKSYYKAFTVEELPQWQSWLHEQLGMWVVPRLVNNLSSAPFHDLSEEFRHIIRNYHSRQYLVLLKENWSIYVRDNPLIAYKDTQNTVRAQLASESVFCRDGNRHILKDTSTGFFLPEVFRSENPSLQPLLDIPNPQDPQWNFLKFFGVAVDDDLSTYLGVLSKIQGREVSIEFVQWLYEEIQGRSKDSPIHVREEFSRNSYIYIACSSTEGTARWVALSDCVWEGPKCLTQTHDLSKIYPDHKILFQKHLDIKKAGIEALVLEAKAIRSSTPLSHITDVFRELSGLLPNSIPAKALLEIQLLLALKIFPLDEGGNSAAGFDDLSSGTTEEEWYIADRPHLRQSFQGRVSLLAFSLEDVQAIRRLVTVFNWENRLLSKAATETRQVPGARALSKETNLVYREKAKFLDRLMPQSTPQKREIVLHLENLEIWQADEILRGWMVQTIGSSSSEKFQEGYADDDGLQALVVPPKEAEPLRIYLRNEESTCPPLELAEQLADFCRVPDHVSLVYFVLNQTDVSSIENTLDRRGFPEQTKENSGEVERINQDEDRTSDPPIVEEAQEPKAPGRSYEKIWIGEDSEQQEDEVPKLNTLVGDEDLESEIDQDEMREQSQTSPTMTTTYTKAVEIPQNEQKASSNPTADGQHAESQSQPTILASKASTSKRPNYISLDDASPLGEYVKARKQHTRRQRRTQVSVSSHGLEKFDWPRIIGSDFVFVQNVQELPPESFSEQAPEGVILPGRAQISQSGDCTVFLAREPPNKIDSYTEFLGELYVSKLLEKHLGRKYDPNSQWTSRYRHRAGYMPFERGKKASASFTLDDGAPMTEFLIQSGSGWKRNGSYPRYHILVKTTNGGQNSSFSIHPEEKEMIREFRLAGDKRPPDVIILARVFDMQSTARASFFVDPWSIYASGGMQIEAQSGTYTAKVDRAQPQLLFEQFEIGELVNPQSLRDVFHLFTSYVRDSGETWARMMIQDDERRYTYRPLGTGPFIRLLRLYPGSAHQDLKGDLEHVSLDSTKTKNPFVALSYVWGNALKPFTLRIGRSKTIRITSSLHFALKRLRDRKRSVLVWADAISIDQNNDREKGHQVRLMSAIYSSAQSVSAWLGEEGEQSNSAIDCFREIRKTFQLSKQTAKVSLPSAGNLVWSAINSFLHRDWFRRVWIVQELVLAPKIILLCGDQRLEWDDLYAVATFCSVEAKKSNAALMNSISQAAAPVLSLGKLRNAYHGTGNTTAQQGLLTLFKDFGHTQSTQRRDKLFAFLGLACDADDAGFDPDYVAPLEDVVQRYAGVFVQRGQGMNLLYHAGIHDLEPDNTRFPSWVPNWVTTSHPKTVTTWTSKSGRFTAASYLKNDIKLAPQNHAILTATAYVVDRIDRVAKTSFAASDLVMYLKEAFSMIESINTYPTNENLKDLVWKIPIGNTHHPPSGSWSKIDFRASYEALVEYLRIGDETTDWNVEISKIRAVAKMRQFLFRPQELRQLMWLYLFTAQEFAESFVNAKLCVTEKGYIGIVPGAACKGSLITVFCGSAVPFVVHKISRKGEDSSYYRHIGESYIHGIMDGAENQKCGLFDALEKKTLYLC